MDYQFKKDLYGQPTAKFSMGHEAVGRWLTDELGNNQKKTQNLLDIVIQIEQGKIGFREITGTEFQLSLSLNNVEVSARATDFELDEELHQDSHLYEGESFSECGLTDFSVVLVSWLDYIN